MRSTCAEKTELHEKQKQKRAVQPERNDEFSVMDKEIYASLPLTRRLDKSGRPTEDHPELPADEQKANVFVRE